MSKLFSHNLSADSDPQIQAELGSRWYLRVYAWVAAGILTPLLIVGLFNYVNDRYAVLRDDSTFMAESNLDFVRLKYLLQNEDANRLILFGNSRANALDLQGRLSESAYTFPIAGGEIYHYLLSLRTLIANDIVPDTVILGLGEAAINPLAKVQQQQPWVFPQIDELSLIEYLRDYLLFVPGERDFVLFRNRVGGLQRGVDQELSRQIISTGRTYFTHREARMNARSDLEHATWLAEAVRRWKRPPQVSQEVADQGIAYALETIGKIQQLADTHGIRLFVYADPMYRDLYLIQDVPALLRFKRELAAIQPFLDFGNLDPTYTNPRYFLDVLHYNDKVGDEMTDDIAAAMRGDTDQLTLGTWITPAIADAYTRELEAEYKKLKQP